MNTPLSHWRDSALPDWDGIVRASGHAFRILNGRLSPTDLPVQTDFVSIYVTASLDLFGGRYRVRCGESSHGSIGFVVLEDAVSGDALWSFVSSESNPFDQIELKGSYVLVLSTSGSIFRFRAELEDVGVFITG
jgi:hypothetical protein